MQSVAVSKAKDITKEMTLITHDKLEGNEIREPPSGSFLSNWYRGLFPPESGYRGVKLIIYLPLVKVKLPLCLTKHDAMKTYCGSGGIAPRILDLGTRWR
jgi:hypothetical protein